MLVVCCVAFSLFYLSATMSAASPERPSSPRVVVVVVVVVMVEPEPATAQSVFIRLPDVIIVNTEGGVIGYFVLRMSQATWAEYRRQSRPPSPG